MSTYPEIQRRDGTLFFACAEGDRDAIATSIERLIDFLDAMTDDPDLEDGGDREPNLGWCGHRTAHYQTFGTEALGVIDDLELDECDDEESDPGEDSDPLEEGGDDEPLLGFLERTGQGLILGTEMEKVGDDCEDVPSCWEQPHYDGSGRRAARQMLRGITKLDDRIAIYTTTGVVGFLSAVTR